VRLTAFIDVDNRRAIRVSTRMGFVVEGLCRLGINGKKDALTFGMLRSDCKFLTGTVARPPVARTQRSVIHG
jgi:RimJ/RimL family protein N-acetyltransferase